MFSITIIGSGPAGCQLAYNLDSRFSVTLVDRNIFPRVKPCGGILIEASVEFLKIFSPPDNIYSKPKHIDLAYLDWDNIIRFKQKRGFQNINRDKFDYWLFNLATNRKNVKFLKGIARKVNQGEKSFVVVETDTGFKKIESDIIVDASGAHSVTRQASSTSQNLYTAVQFELEASKKFEDFNYILANSLSDYYSWLVPKGDSVLVGSCFNARVMKDNVEKFKKMFSDKFGLDFENSAMQAAPLFRPLSVEDLELVRKDVFVLGEAAGLISPSTGEGISYALRSAKACAEAINENTDFRKARQDYLVRVKPLVDEIESKIQRAKLLMNIEKRREFFNGFVSAD